jgi:hypothetical protein
MNRILGHAAGVSEFPEVVDQLVEGLVVAGLNID